MKVEVYRKEDILQFEPRVRQIDLVYEMKNNHRFEDGVYISQQTMQSRNKTAIFSQKSNTRTFTSKHGSGKNDRSPTNKDRTEETKKL